MEVCLFTKSLRPQKINTYVCTGNCVVCSKLKSQNCLLIVACQCVGFPAKQCWLVLNFQHGFANILHKIVRIVLNQSPWIKCVDKPRTIAEQLMLYALTPAAAALFTVQLVAGLLRLSTGQVYMYISVSLLFCGCPSNIPSQVPNMICIMSVLRSGDCLSESSDLHVTIFYDKSVLFYFIYLIVA